jgi:hypothetical protein
MKQKILISIFIFLMAAGGFAQSGEITVTSVQQRPDGSGLVDVYFNLSGPSSAYNIEMQASFDGGITYSQIPPAFLSGDMGGISPGGNKHIVWDGLGSFPNTFSTQTRLELSAILSNSIISVFNIGEYVNYLPGNSTYHFNNQDIYSFPDGSYYVSYYEKLDYPIRYKKYLILNDSLNLSYGPKDIINNDQRTQYTNYSVKDNFLYFVCLHVTGGKDPLKFGKVSLDNYSSLQTGSKSWWPTNAFSDNNIRKLFISSTGNFYIINSWRYNGWSVSKEDIYISKSSNNMSSWSNWIKGGHAFGEGTFLCHTALEYNNEIIMCLQTTWGETDKIVLVKFNMGNNTFSNFVHVANGNSSNLFINGSNLAITYINSSGEPVAKYSTTSNWNIWSEEIIITSFSPVVHLYGNSNTDGMYDYQRQLLLLTMPENQYVLEWDGNTTWNTLGYTPMTMQDVEYVGGKLTLDSKNDIIIIKGYKNGSDEQFTHVIKF